MDINEIILFWNNNYYSQTVCVTNLLALIESMAVSSDIKYLQQDAIKVLNAIVNKIDIRNKVKLYNTIKFFESFIDDTDLLLNIACILSGEYLSEDLDNLVSIVEFWKWDVPVAKNIFISWYYDLINNVKYHRYVISEYKYRHNITIIQFLMIIITGFILILSVESLLYFLSYTYLTNIPGLIIIVIQVIILMLLLMIIYLILNHFKLYELIKIKPKFYKYKIRRKL